MQVLKYEAQRIQLELTQDDCSVLAAALQEHAATSLPDQEGYWSSLATVFQLAAHVLKAEGFMLDAETFEIDLVLDNEVA